MHELLRLAPPTIAEREALGLPATSGLPEVARLRALARCRWNEGELRQIGRKLRNALSSVSSPHSLRDAGYVPFSLLIVSSATISHLLDALHASGLRSGILFTCRIVEYQDPESWLAANKASLASDPPDGVLLALDRHSLHLQCAPGDETAAQACVEAAVSRVRRIAEEFRAITKRSIILQTLAGEAADPQSSMDAWLPGSPRRLLAEFNREIAGTARASSCYLFDVASIAELVGHDVWNAGRYWYVAKLPFAPECVPLYTYRLVELVAAMLGKSRRVLVLDLDETLWGGVIGDDGIGGLVLGAGSARGEAHLAIQRMALHYKQRGVILCVASKNDDEIARDVFRRHPEMIVSETDITLFEVNWGDKASSIKSMAETLDLGLETFVFIDDNPVERKQVRDAHPLVAIPELPGDPAGWIPVIQGAGYFEQTSFSAEDLVRTEYYRGNARRRVQAQAVGDPRKFLESLQMELTVERFNALGRARIAQLIAKSNQFNLTTHRYSEAEIAAFEADPSIDGLQFRLGDIFGDNGMISVVISRKQQSYWEIDTWIMSCRVLGRGVEQAVLGIVAERARAGGARELRGRYIPTGRNALVRDHYLTLGFTKMEETELGQTTWSLLLSKFTPADVPILKRDRTMEHV